MIPRIFVLSATLLVLFISPLNAAETASSEEQSLSGNYSSTQVDSIIAGLDDTQVRRMLIEELKQKATEEAIPSQTNPEQKRAGARIAKWLQEMGSESDDTNKRLVTIRNTFKQLVPTLISTFRQIEPPNSSLPLLAFYLIIFGILAASLVLKKWFVSQLTRKHFSINIEGLPQMGGPAKFISGFTQIIPEFLGIFVFTVTAYILFIALLDTKHPPLNLFFIGILLYLALLRCIAILSHLITSPTVLAFRILPIACNVANNLHKAIVGFCAYVLSVFSLVILVRALGADMKVVVLMQALGATLLIFSTIILVWVYKGAIGRYIQTANPDLNTSWANNVFASTWHLLATLYLFLLWVLLIYDFSHMEYRSGKGAFLLSFLIVPIWMLVNSMGQWVTRNVLSSLGLYQSEYPATDKPPSDEELARREEGKKLFAKATNITKIVVTIAVGIWLASLWNFYVPYISDLSGVFFDTMIILSLSLIFWKTICSWIENKLLEATPVQDESEEDIDSEWGGAATKGRVHTLLPMLRKFIGTVLVVMVTLTILSSLGVDIGPLLAGAGVVGLAVGFGAQKLVSDVFSGFFYLLDDAFRVGEYIEAGSVTGAVEDITLRNVMLRHHRGMLQIVPHSELGAITNFMRGGIIVKFNLDFPYDANIEQIRKVIKKVGQAMLKDEELGKDFIQPVKSAGVREITNSVMTIRVKFTAQPGSHFVIRREAYRRITEALNAKGINYAHRKVIVDIPQAVVDAAGTPGSSVNSEQAKQIVNAAGAAAMSAIEQEGEKKV